MHLGRVGRLEGFVTPVRVQGVGYKVKDSELRVEAEVQG
jgi:hypothetical protein